MQDDKMDEFLNDATLAVREMWESNYPEMPLGENETYALNDVLAAFFHDKSR